MTYRYLVADDVTNEKRLGAAASGIGPIFSPEIFYTGAGETKTVFNLANNSMTANTKIMVFHNGISVDEGDDYTFSFSAKTVTFNYTIKQLSKVKILIFN